MTGGREQRQRACAQTFRTVQGKWCFSNLLTQTGQIQTIFGSFKSDFDFMAQMFVIRESESEHSTGKLQTATMASASGSPTAMTLSHLH